MTIHKECLGCKWENYPTCKGTIMFDGEEMSIENLKKGFKCGQKEEDNIMSQRLRVAHYLNQFFGGLGGEDKAFEGPKLKDGLIGPGQAVQQALGNRGEVVATIICGDNYFAERTKEASEEVIQLLTPYKPDIRVSISKNLL